MGTGQSMKFRKHVRNFEKYESTLVPINPTFSTETTGTETIDENGNCKQQDKNTKEDLRRLCAARKVLKGLSGDEFQKVRTNREAFKQFIQKMNIEDAFEKFRISYMSTANVFKQPQTQLIPIPKLSKSESYSVPPIEGCCRNIEIELNEAFEATTAKCTKDKKVVILTSNFNSKIRDYENHLNSHMNLICC